MVEKSVRSIGKKPQDIKEETEVHSGTSPQLVYNHPSPTNTKLHWVTSFMESTRACACHPRASRVHVTHVHLSRVSNPYNTRHTLNAVSAVCTVLSGDEEQGHCLFCTCAVFKKYFQPSVGWLCRNEPADTEGRPHAFMIPNWNCAQWFWHQPHTQPHSTPKPHRLLFSCRCWLHTELVNIFTHQPLSATPPQGQELLWIHSGSANT